MNVLKLSTFLQNSREILVECRDILLKQFDYVSFLGTDSPVLNATVDSQTSSLSESRWVERGFVCRLQKEGLIWEYSFNRLPETAASLAEEISRGWIDQEELLSSERRISYTPLEDEPWEEEWFGKVERSAFQEPVSEIFGELQDVQKSMMEELPFISYAMARYHSVEVHKIFISPNKNLAQAYNWSEGYLWGTFRKGEQSRDHFLPFSGLKGLELLQEFRNSLEVFKELVEPLLEAESITPGEYEVVLGPDVAGVLAHEAFGHGVETDTFVKGRALAAEYLGKPVASPLVDMHDGARGVQNISSYLFDDEGNGGTDQLVIEKGILKTGFGDELSLKQLGWKPTGNGKRESYRRKAYARMTNTWFAPGKDKLDDMITSVKKGYLLEVYNSGMEDPKNWGIQLACPYGKEIIDGKLTGKLVAPVILTGFVPDVLKGISMVSPHLKLSGSGACGKGYKELVKVSSGGPYLKTKMRLG